MICKRAQVVLTSIADSTATADVISTVGKQLCTSNPHFITRIYVKT